MAALPFVRLFKNHWLFTKKYSSFGKGEKKYFEGWIILFDGKEIALRALVRALLVVTLIKFVYPPKRMLSAAAGVGCTYDQSSVFWHLRLIAVRLVLLTRSLYYSATVCSVVVYR